MPSPIAKVLCGAKKRDGTPCKQPAMPNGRCKMHGGKSLTGMANPAFKTGRYSKHIPPRMRQRYTEALDDPDLISLRGDLALVEARLVDVLARVDTGESGDRWRLLKAAWDQFARARSGGDLDEMGATLAEVEKAITKGVQDYAAWTEVRSLLDQRTRLAEAERKRLEAAHQTVTVSQMMTFLGVLQDSISRHVADRKAVAAIGADIMRLIDAQPPQPAQVQAQGVTP